ncbi:phosphomannomutase/phosphoglucomutase [Betaproteobacteria bacterium LSUCC0115]|nr:phosphomannomutase/phosphoglucomutase [Burkholderiales bacterium LSUCC0115]
MNLPAAIFKAYDIRGIVDQTLTEEGVLAIGQALGLLMHQQGQGQGRCVVGRDGRLSGPRLVEALTAGLTQAGIDVIQIGMVPTPVVYFATHELQTGTGVAITGSHNPPNYNGLKMMVAGTTLSGEAIQTLYQSIVSGESQAHADRVNTGGRLGQVSQADVRQAYLDRIVSDVKWARPMRVAIDAGNGVAGELAPQLMKRLGADLTSLFCEVDGHFPNHHPDPADPHNLEDLIAAVAAQDLELGLAFDGDGDRLGVVTRSGKIIWPDRQLMLYAADVLAQQPGAQIIFDVKCSRQLAQHIKAHGGEPLMWRTGHSLIKAKLKETKAPLAGEMSGHVFFNDRWYGFDDGLYAAARLLEILSRSDNPSAILEALPDAISTPELQVKTQEGENHQVVARLRDQADFPTAQSRITIDGIRVEYADGFGLARASNTTPVVVLRFEADTEQALARIQAEFKAGLLSVMPSAQLPF